MVWKGSPLSYPITRRTQWTNCMEQFEGTTPFHKKANIEFDRATQTAPLNHVGSYTHFIIVTFIVNNIIIIITCTAQQMHLHTFICHLIYLPASMFIWKCCVMSFTLQCQIFFLFTSKYSLEKLKSPCFQHTGFSCVTHFLILIVRRTRERDSQSQSERRWLNAAVWLFYSHWLRSNIYHHSMHPS